MKPLASITQRLTTSSVSFDIIDNNKKTSANNFIETLDLKMSICYVTKTSENSDIVTNIQSVQFNLADNYVLNNVTRFG